MYVKDVAEGIYPQLLDRVAVNSDMESNVIYAVRSAIREVVRAANGVVWHIRVSTQKTTPDHPLYTLPWGVVEVPYCAFGHRDLPRADDREYVENCKAQDTATPTPYPWPDWHNDEKRPEAFTIEFEGRRLTLRLLPAPTTEDFLRIGYRADEKRVDSLGDVIDIPPEYETALSCLAMSKMWKGLPGNEGSAASEFKRYQQEIAAANKKCRVRGPQVIRERRPSYRWD